MSLTLEGKDNYGRPRQEFADKIAAEDDDTFETTAAQHIYLHAYAANNPRSDFHWMEKACRDEAAQREDPDIYHRAYNRAWGIRR